MFDYNDDIDWNRDYQRDHDVLYQHSYEASSEAHSYEYDKSEPLADPDDVPIPAADTGILRGWPHLPDGSERVSRDELLDNLQQQLDATIWVDDFANSLALTLHRNADQRDAIDKSERIRANILDTVFRGDVS